ncbi:hypothetical protein [Nostocoides vanveenii]|uniref:DUF3990 domain-containing protein n=1 Tax=Nostocoides vanveenii TaxID=330835 RepID=A0ABP4XFX7_9MICO
MPTDSIYAFHGTTSSVLDSIATSGLQKTIGGGHWLGDNGIYFVPRDPKFALGYALQKVRRDRAKGIDGSPVVIRATIDMRECFDLLLIEYRELLKDFAPAYLDTVPESVWPEVAQDQIRRGLDSMVIRQAMKVLRTSGGKPYASLQAAVPARFGEIPKGVYPPGGALYQVGDKKSWFDIHDHVQLIVFDESCISDVEVVEV